MTNPLDSEMVTDESLVEEPFISKLEGRSWGFAYVRSRAEKKLLEKMTSREIPCYLPVIRKMRIHHRGKVFSEIPMFPSYLFLCPEPSSLLDVRCQKEVVSLNIVEGPAENDFINELNLIRKFELFARNRKTVVNPEIQPGSTVLIKEGPLRNSEVIVLRRQGDVSVIVNLFFLGRSCECKISADELKLLI